MARFLSTKTVLAASGSWTSGMIQGGRGDKLVGSVFADQTGNIFIEQSFDGTNWDVSTTYAITASDGKGFTEELVAPYARVRYVNGATLQGAFRLYARVTSAGD